MDDRKNILVLGGSTFIGPALLESGILRGHKLTLFNRGRSFPENASPKVQELMQNAETIHGDRMTDLELLADRSWDMVIDTCGYEPEAVDISTRFFNERTTRYMFISSISAYENFDRPGLTEEQAFLRKLPAEGPADYGALKSACEKVVELVFGPRALIIRPGLIVGPHDPTDRFTYWIHRVVEGGDIVAPGRKNAHVQFIDVRDLGAWMILLTEKEQENGEFHVTGPGDLLTMERFLDECKSILNPKAKFSWVSESVLQDLGAKPWTQLPLWIPDSEKEARFMRSIDCSKARKAGLKIRPLSDTIFDTATWHRTRTLEGGELQAGLTPDFEQMIFHANLSREILNSD